MLAVARDDSRDPDEVKNAALQIMAMNYRDQSDPSGPVDRKPILILRFRQRTHLIVTFLMEVAMPDEPRFFVLEANNKEAFAAGADTT